jgi:CrcB protein
MVAGALGALARYALQAVIDRRTGGLPWSTFLINVSGAFVIGLVFTITTERVALDPWLRTAITVGFLGAFTTFSTLAFDTVRLFDAGRWVAASLNIAGTSLTGIAAVIAGMWLGRVVP